MTDLDLNALGIFSIVLMGIGLVAGAEELSRKWSGGISMTRAARARISSWRHDFLWWASASYRRKLVIERLMEAGYSVNTYEGGVFIL